MEKLVAVARCIHHSLKSRKCVESTNDSHITSHNIGEKGVDIFNSFIVDMHKTTIKDIKEKFDNYFEPH